MTTLVTGATGNTGRHVVTELVRRGERVRALTRDPVAAAGRFPAEVELAAGTHTKPETLDAALDGVSRLHITVTPGLADVEPELVRRAVAAGVRRLTVVWGGGVGPVEEAVADSGVEWTRLEPQEFMSTTLDWSESIRAEGSCASRTTIPAHWSSGDHRCLPWDAEYVVGWYAAPNDSSTTVVDTVEQVTGRPARTFAQWATEHAGRFTI